MRSLFPPQVLRLLAPLTLLGLALAPAAGATAATTNPFCAHLGHSIQASSGAQMFCFGPQAQQPASGSPGTVVAAAPVTTNVDAADPHEDISPSGAQAYGQSETSIAAYGPYVVEAWNDATGFFSPCPSPQHKEELTGFGFSADGGQTFHDLGGLPNNDCSYHLFGDPSVEVYSSGGHLYFYISSLYDRPDLTGVSFLALNVCELIGTGSSATLSCGQPVMLAESTGCVTPPGGPTFCNFLDKEYLTIDATRGRLYASYTEFGVTSALAQGQVELAVCDIGMPDGSPGFIHGTAGNPRCTQPSTSSTLPSPYFIVAPGEQCENEGAYPAVDLTTGDVYVAWEYNWASNIFFAPCEGIQTQNRLARVALSCLHLLPTSPCSSPTATTAMDIVSLAAAFIPGYNRFPMNDFPRIAVSEPLGTVSIVWNDGRLHPTGDILLQSWALESLAPIQFAPVKLNGGPDDVSTAWHFLPALRNPDYRGTLNVAWYDRRLHPTEAYTDVFAALGVSPRTMSTPGTNVRITTVSSNWNAVSSDIVPNFGDYTDLYVRGTAGTATMTGKQVFVAWSDGRLGLPQPFEANLPT